jgi:electron transfer flavoprotein alpha subunit
MNESKKEIWVVLYDTMPDSLCLVSKAFELSEQRGFVCRAVYLAPALASEDSMLLAQAGAERITHIPIKDYSSNCEYEIRNCLTDAIIREKPYAVLFISSIFSSAVAPGVAALLKVGITADCTQLYWDEKGNLIQSRPTYGGRAQANILSQTIPVIATVRRGIFRLNKRTPITPSPADIIIPKKESDFCKILKITKGESQLDLRQAKIILAGGVGLGSKSNFDRLYELASKVGGEVAASRGAVAAGYAGFDRQVGQTGVAVRPKLYIAFGISGAVQHLSGMIESEEIIAVNTDRKAPIHSISHYSIYTDANKVIGQLLELLSQKNSI